MEWGLEDKMNVHYLAQSLAWGKPNVHGLYSVSLAPAADSPAEPRVLEQRRRVGVARQWVAGVWADEHVWVDL